jgi:hypothetical protein
VADATKTAEQTFYQRHLLAEALCGHSLWRDIQHASGELPGPIVFKDELRALRSQLGKSHEDQWIERLTALGVQVKAHGTVRVQAHEQTAAYGLDTGYSAEEIGDLPRVFLPSLRDPRE